MFTKGTPITIDDVIVGEVYKARSGRTGNFVQKGGAIKQESARTTWVGSTARGQKNFPTKKAAAAFVEQNGAGDLAAHAEKRLALLRHHGLATS